MRRNVILAVVVVAAPSIAGVGGVFSTWADSETSTNNYIETGAVDLKVNGKDDVGAGFWGDGVGPVIQLSHVRPCVVHGPVQVDLWNAGVCNTSSRAYIDLKSHCCSNIPPKLHPETGNSTGYWDSNTMAYKPEPEMVAEYGGKVNCATVEGIGVTGDGCTMLSHVYCWIMLDETEPVQNVSYNSTVCAFQGMLGEMYDSDKIHLFDLMPCNQRPIYLWFHLEQESEEDYGHSFIPNVTTPGEPGYMNWKMFNDWPSWALMCDKVDFDLEFDLWLVDPPVAS